MMIRSSIKTILLCAALLYVVSAQGQTYSKIYDIEEFNLRNYFRSSAMLENNLYVLSMEFCNRDSFYIRWAN